MTPEDRPRPRVAQEDGGPTPYRFSCPMRWGDMDAQGHINNAAYLDYLQEARVAFLLSGPPPLVELLATGVLVVSHQVEYLQPVQFSDRGLTLDLWVESVGGSRFTIGYDIWDGEVLAARAHTGAVPFDLATNVLRRLQPVERELLAAHRHDAAPLRSLPRVRWTTPDHHYPLAVRWSDLDSYGHVNNVKFFDYVQEARIALIQETVGWSEDDVWLVVRQDLEYLKPLDFRIEPYEVGSVVSQIGNRSFTLAAEIRDPESGEVFAAARTIVVGVSPLTEPMRQALSRWAL